MQCSSDHAEQEFSYDVLDSGEYQRDSNITTRLMHLLPSSEFDADIRCSLDPVRLLTSTEYAALSYAWGDLSKKKFITVNGKSFYVTANLHEALRYLRSEVAPLALWVDAICINQNDVPERDHQVQKMGEIYAQATTVYAWVGTKCEEVELAWPFLQSVHDRYSAETGQTLEDSAQNILKRFSTGSSRAQLEHVQELLIREYWSRLWIVQELSAAKTTVVICGHLQLAWPAVMTWVRIRLLSDLRAQRNRLARITTGKPLNWENARLYAIEQIALVLDRPLSATKSLLVLLECTRTFKTSEPKDKIYAVLGLHSLLGGHDRRKEFPVKYGDTIGQVLVELVNFAFNVSHNLSFLSHVRMSRDRSKWTPGVPTWAPDWTQPRYFHALTLADTVHETSGIVADLFSATKGIDSNEIRFRIQNQKLALRGFKISVIQRLSTTSRSTEAAWQKDWTSCAGIDTTTFQLPKDKSPFWNIERGRDPVKDDYMSVFNACYLPEPKRKGTEGTEQDLAGEKSDQNSKQWEMYWRTVLGDTWVGSKDIERLHGSPEFAELCDNFPQTPGQLERLKIGLLQGLPQFCAGRKLFRTKEPGNLLGLAPPNAREGDIICAFFGGDVLYIVREYPERTEFVGEW